MIRKTSALAILDFADIPAGLWAADAILKKAPIAFVQAGTVTNGRYLIVFGGSTASTAESLAEALEVSGNAIIDHTFLPDAHPALFDAAFGARRKSAGSLLIIETETASSIVRAVEAALKGTPVELMEIRLADAGLAGKGIALMAGSLHDVEYAAILAAYGTGVDAPAPRGFSYRLIAAPHEIMEREVAALTRFDAAPLLELDGETC